MTESRSIVSDLCIAKEDGRSAVRIFLSSPTPLEEKNLGNLFAVLEIESEDPVCEDILNILTEELNNQYYQSETFELEAAFEYALQKANQKIQEVIAEIGDTWLDQANMVLGVHKGDRLIFANIGRVIALMIHHGKIIDILDTAKAKAQEINPLKVFSNIVSGKLVDQSIVIFSTETILDYLSKEKIKRIVVEKKPREASEELYNLLADNTTNNNFATLIMQRERQTVNESTRTEIPVINRPAPLNEQRDSMTTLLGKQTETEELLTSSIWPGIKKALQRKMESTFRRQEQPEKPAPRKPLTSVNRVEDDALNLDTDDILGEGNLQHESVTPARSVLQNSRARKEQTPMAQVQKTALKIMKMIGTGLVAAAGALQSGVMQLVQRLRKKSGGTHNGNTATYAHRRREQRSPIAMVSKWFTRLGQWFKSLSLMQRAFFIVAIIVLLIFAQSVVNRGEQKTSKEQETQYGETLSSIDLKINEGKAAVLYDSESARNLFLEARTMLDQIPKDSDTYKQRGEELANVISSQLKRVNNVITLDNPTPVLDFTKIHPSIQLGHTILLGASVYAFDQNSASAYRGNLEDKGVSVTISDSSTGGRVTAAAKASLGTGVTTLSNNTFAIFNPVEEALNPLDLKYKNAADHTFTDIRVFGTRLYTLDTKSNQIFRHSPTNGIFGEAIPWIDDDNIDIRNAVSFAIDGEIFVLNSDATVTRLAGGAKKDFALAQIDPALTSAEKMYTDENTSNLYVLDAKGQRVIVFDKNGKLVAQYTSSTFTNLKDMIVDETNKKMYLLNDAQVYEVQLQDAPTEQASSVPSSENA
ncbi:MAG: hypothetical protein HYV32_00235 [Candidatus Kerfeldbacteria bacterium]|nr:hypothetical protein [Candidatus Kerfeldbacteria bacterium]